MKLREFLKSSRTKFNVFSKEIGVSIRVLQGYKNQARSASLITALKVFLGSNGRVSFVEQLSTPDLKEFQQTIEKLRSVKRNVSEFDIDHQLLDKFERLITTCLKSRENRS